MCVCVCMCFVYVYMYVPASVHDSVFLCESEQGGVVVCMFV